MKRPFVPLLLFAVLALVAASAAPAQEVERPPTELWDEFPLEPTATPSAATPQATPTPRVVREPASDGMSPPALVALLIAAAGLGALAARTAARRLRPSVGATPPSPTVASADAPVAEPKLLTTMPRRAAPQSDPPAAQPEPAAPSNGQPEPRAAPPEEPTPRGGGAEPATGPAKRRSAGSTPGAGEPKRRGAQRDPATGRYKRRAAQRDPTTGGPKRRTSKSDAAPNRRGRRAAEPDATAGPPDAPAAAPDPTSSPPTPPTTRPEPSTPRPERRAAKGDRNAAPPERRAAEPAAPPSSRPEREDAIPPKRFPAATPEPTPAPAAPPRPFVEPASPAFDACRIRLHNRSIKAHFFAVPYDGGPVLARSPYFKIRRAEDEPGVSAPEALRALVNDLTAAGWRQTSAGRAPWDLRFERATSAQEPAAPRGAR